MAPSASGRAGHTILKTLGKGGEGTVYLIRETATNRRAVLKLFRAPIVAPGLVQYAAEVNCRALGLVPIELLECGGALVGLCYPYVPLVSLHRRVLLASDEVAQACFGAYCRMQAFLMAHHRLGLSDTVVDNFMMSREGRFFFVDFGWGVRRLDSQRGWAQGRWEYGFVMMLLSLYGKNLKLEMQPQDGYSGAGHARYCWSQQLDEIAARRAWVAALVRQIRSQPAACFLDPPFYAGVAQRFPCGVRFPHLARWISQSIRYGNQAQRLIQGGSPS